MQFQLLKIHENFIEHALLKEQEKKAGRTDWIIFVTYLALIP